LEKTIVHFFFFGSVQMIYSFVEGNYSVLKKIVQTTNVQHLKAYVTIQYQQLDRPVAQRQLKQLKVISHH